MKNIIITTLAIAVIQMNMSADSSNNSNQHRQLTPVGTEAFSRIEGRIFGQLDDGTTVQQYILRNANGMEVRLIEYGATLTAINIPNGKGGLLNVIQGEESLDPFVKGYPSASVIGRFANRIAHGKYTLDGKEHEVTRNAGPHHIHGGRKGFAKVVWQADPMPFKDNASAVRLTYEAKDGEEGFPGNMKVSVTYVLTDANEVKLIYSAKTDKPSPINLTNHAYFNLADQGGFENHEMWINSATYTLADRQLIPTGKIGSVEGTALDFRTPHPIGERADDTQPRPHLYDHNFIIIGGGQSIVHTATAKEPVSGRIMKVYTDQPGVQLYTGNPRGFCLETQHYPDSVNHPEFPSTILRPGETFESTTIYAFEF